MLDVEKFAYCLRMLGIKDLSFKNRRKLCHLAYLLTVFGVDIGLPLGSFKWYMHGIYNVEISELKTEILEKIRKERLYEND